MKTILLKQFINRFIYIRILIFAVITISANIFSQDDIQEYKPPKLMKGFNLTLETSPSFASYLNNDQYKQNTFIADMNATVNQWRFTDNFLYAAAVSISGAASKKYYSTIDEVYNPGWGSYFDFRFSGGASYYPFKDFYANLYINSDNMFQSRRFPYFPFEIYPGIGYGRMFDVSRVNQMQNFESALEDEKIINSPLKKSTRKKLTELLDKRQDRDFLSMFKDDGDIEFFARVEDLFKDEGVIQGNLSSRAVLRMYQALTNNSYVYFPVFKGFQVQAETKVYSKYNYNYNGSIKEYCIYLFNAYILSGIYGLPVNRKLSFLGSAYTVIPVFEKFLQDGENFEFNSPITLAERNSLNYDNFRAISQTNNNYGESFTKMDVGLSLQGFYSISRFCGLASDIYTEYLLRDYEGDEITGGAGASFVFNILNHLKMKINFDISSTKNTKYRYTFSSDVTYYVF